MGMAYILEVLCAAHTEGLVGKMVANAVLIVSPENFQRNGAFCIRILPARFVCMCVFLLPTLSVLFLEQRCHLF